MYYTGNEIYRYLIERHLTDCFFWLAEDMWALLYSDAAGKPLLLCFVSRVAYESELDSPATEEEAQAFRRFVLLAKQADLPLISLRFAAEPDRACKSFRFKKYQGGQPASRVSPDRLLEILRELGLPVRGENAGKPVNDQASSSFHMWQRAHMGKQVIAVDLDLVRFCGERVDTLYELKRSWVPLQDWAPFENDKSNYLAVARLAQRLGAEYHAVYNVRHTEPEYWDDISRLKVYDMVRGWPGEFLGQFNVEDYFK